MTTERPSAAERYAVKFNVDAPDFYPDDGALYLHLRNCALRPPAWLYPEIRAHVLRLRLEALPLPEISTYHREGIAINVKA